MAELLENLRLCLIRLVDILPRTTYGLSRLHGGQLLKYCVSNIALISRSSLGMHESMLRTGSYVLSKIKNIIFNKQRGVIPSRGFGEFEHSSLYKLCR